MLKRILTMMMALLMLSSINVYAENEEYKIGAYYQLGKYNGSPIIWRCVSTDDENGILMVSDKILCFKVANAGKNDKESVHGYKDIYGSSFWEESTIRQWLNSTDDAGNIEWLNYPPDKEHIQESFTIFNGEFIHVNNTNFYADEAGFLSQNNFTESELSVLKTVNQWQVLPSSKLDFVTNGVSTPYITWYYKEIGQGDSKYVGGIDRSSPVEMKESYTGAMNRVSDTVFLLDPSQINSLYEATGEIVAKSVISPSPEILVTESGNYAYWLRTPYNEISDANWPSTSIKFQLISEKGTLGFAHSSATEEGVRPAFYLNEATAQIKSGSGTENAPYILDGTTQNGITVFSNGEQVNFEQESYIENDHTLVGMRAVFESLGAEVDWNGEDKTVTAVKDDTKIQLQIDNNIMQVNDESVELETPARLVNDNTMVPIRAVSEAFDARVEWIDDLQRVVVDEQPEWVGTDWNPDWYIQAMIGHGYMEYDPEKGEYVLIER